MSVASGIEVGERYKLGSRAVTMGVYCPMNDLAKASKLGQWHTRDGTDRLQRDDILSVASAVEVQECYNSECRAVAMCRYYAQDDLAKASKLHWQHTTDRTDLLHRDEILTVASQPEVWERYRECSRAVARCR